MPQPTGYVDPRYLQTAGEMLKHVKELSYKRMQIHPGHQALDVGCGPGLDTISLAHLVGPTGTVVGVDLDETMIVKADKHAAQAGVSTWVKHKLSDAVSLPFNSDYFDSCRSARLFQHLANPGQVIAESIRVIKPAGWMVALDSDWGTLSIDTIEVAIERKLTRFIAEKSFHNGFSGRRLYRLFKQQNLLNVTIELFPNYTTNYSLARYMLNLDDNEKKAVKAGVITNKEIKNWHRSLEEAEKEDVFFGSFTLMLVAGRKPS